MTEEMQTPWTLSAIFEHNSAMQDFTEPTFTTSRQHKDSTEACIKFFWSKENADTDYNLLTIHS
ncbi:hypothetical protein DPMN_177299 [Dreissena polymorpha]|uniref:Uncharacterized protein n=1 Tax=Dreissena polymorpha TaxID=45954 RepID=A0A9D4EBG4_DREPO|nr:hypothetical protein DPMN_177299 [Dreissena polymorpha]